MTTRLLIALAFALALITASLAYRKYVGPVTTTEPGAEQIGSAMKRKK